MLSHNKEAQSDKDSILLVDVCKKRIATVGGDGYDELVLYQDIKTNKYYLHYYAKYEYMKNEEHSSYNTSCELYQKILKYIEDNNILQMKDNNGLGLCGGDYILKFKYKDELIRLDSRKMNDNFKAYYDIRNMMQNEIKEENRCYKL